LVDHKLMAQIEIVVDNPGLLFRVFDAKQVSTGMSRDIPGGATLVYAPSNQIERRSADLSRATSPEIIFIVTFGANVAAQVVANWLSAKLLSEPTRKVTINRQKIEITPEGIRRIISESIKYEK